MKKTTIMMLLTAMMLAAVATGCGNNQPETTASVQEVESTVNTETAKTETPETEAVEATETAEETETVESTEILETEAVATETVDTAEETTNASGYTYKDMDKTMYAKSSVNLRKEPNKDSEKAGSLKTNEEVKVTGKCNETGWYRIAKGNDSVYVSDKYLTDSKTAADSKKSDAADTASKTNTSTAADNTASQSNASAQTNTQAAASQSTAASNTNTNASTNTNTQAASSQQTENNTPQPNNQTGTSDNGNGGKYTGEVGKVASGEVTIVDSSTGLLSDGTYLQPEDLRDENTTFRQDNTLEEAYGTPQTFHIECCGQSFDDYESYSAHFDAVHAQ